MSVATFAPMPPPQIPGKTVPLPGPPPGLDPEDADAYAAMRRLLDLYGLGTLAQTLLGYIQDGYGADTITLLLQETPEWKTRFIGNERRRAAGLPVLSPAEYLSVESAYRQILTSAGLPTGFYDSPSDFADWMGKDVSPKEVQDRVSSAVEATLNAPPEFKNALQQLYGIDEGHAVAYFLDTNRALPLINKQVAASHYGAAALRHRISTSLSLAEKFATLGVSPATAEQGFTQIEDFLAGTSALSQIHGGPQYTAEQAQEEVFGGDAAARQRRRQLYGLEQAGFAGSAALGQKGLGKSVSGRF